MARYTRIEVATVMKNTGIVPLFFHSDYDIVKRVIKACYDGGARVFEFTNRGDYAIEVFSEVSKWLVAELPDMIIGVGSIVDAATASLYIQNGANFIVSPILNPEIGKTCNRRKIAWLPGCGTLTEINSAEELGAEIVKIFPASELGGADFIKNIKAPCPWTSIMASGGVVPEKDNLIKWFQAGAYCVGMGSKLIVKNGNRDYDYNKITDLTRKSIQIISDYKKNLI
ncbi:bifunctional 4-hydroxy-2-oxoglutarate aldolase/2-dehydro-3-deoxy-phosphogluconate aldolase [Aquimarina gracilis]|uniref:Bifunctional 4-hydroxy-2-oxoglutarate aldolase/2-dehydro-3-deoxy-phosphogluconate aldolase n=1 Tax=Aquimarina gracilis TaxID=874422 RepID=A0ABU5ZUE2_9FLAO|nr:bifunctional 4-hydroxy-2-oxoglutarate aldolase/2-dehydro-3-deoxy-phosphogluconate aldolase [Aquimarina gracilis]MEB3345701.1 bifunctional 4-hydroxy-2-oxoglutarate aldolase/2-dehydro-3-deoxy-phosphogluconate aldolase [Aquimarina gracilis]